MSLSFIIKEIEAITKSKISLVQYPNIINQIKLPYCFLVKTHFHGRIIEAWGTDFNKDLAVTKSVFELLERIILSSVLPIKYKQIFTTNTSEDIFYHKLMNRHQNSISLLGNTSSGISIHQCKEQAKLNALNELIERHVILKAINYFVVPRKTDQFYVKEVNQFDKIHKVNLSFFYWHGPLNRYITVLKIGNNNWPGNLYAFGCDEKLKIASQKAYFEGTGMILSLLGKSNFSATNQFQKIQSFNLVNSSSFLSKFFSDNHQTYNNYVDDGLKFSEFYFADLTNILGTSSKYYCIKVISPKVQQLFLEKWNNANINRNAIAFINPEIQNEYSVIS